MHIAIDARMYGVAQRGIGRYVMKLIENLETIESTPPLTPPRQGGESEQFPPLPEGRIKEGWEFTIFLRSQNFEEYQPHNQNFKKALWDVPWYGLKEQITGYTLHATRYTLHHFPHWNVPLLFRRPFVVTIHDLELFSSNRTHENTTRGRLVYWLKHLAFRVVFRHAVLASRAIIVPSNVVREQLLGMYPQVRKKMHVIYEAPTIEGSGVRCLSAQADQVSESALKPITYNLKPQRYALYVGAAYPHKNLSRLLEAWKIVHQELPGYKLVLVGREDFFWKKLKLGIGNWKLDIRERLVLYGEATDADLAELYKNASLLVQPSLEEGFSLPPLEALSFGTPVAVSDIPIHREILGNAAIFFDPKNIPAMAEIIKNALISRDSSAQAAARAKTLLLKYSWPTHAQQTLALYRSAASQSRGNSVK